MIKDNFTLLLCLTFLVLSFIIFQYVEILKTKKSAVIQLDLLRNQIAEEKNILETYNKEVVKIDIIEKDVNQKLRILKTKIVTLDFSFKELIACIIKD